MRPIRSMIIVLHHFHLDQLNNVLTELKRTTFFDEENRLTIIDVPSTQESREYLSKIDWADIVICNHEYWMRGSWNQGFRRVHSKYYVTCHTDIARMTKGWRERMIDYLETHPEVGAVGPYIQGRGVGSEPYLMSALVMYRRNCLEDVGVFDEEFDPFFTAEDEEWGARARKKGWKLIRLDKGSGTEITHLHGESGNYYSWFGVPLYTRKIEQQERKDIEYLSKIPEPSGLVREEEKKEYLPPHMQSRYSREKLLKMRERVLEKYKDVNLEWKKLL